MLTKLTSSPRNVFLLALVLCVVVLLMWYTFRFKTRQQEIADLQSQVDTLNSQMLQLRGAQAQLPALREAVAKLKVDQDKFLAALPTTANFGSVLDELRLTTAASGAKMTTFSVASGNTTGLPAGVRPISLNVGLDGKFAQLFQTLRSIETMGRFTTVNNLGLQMATADSFDPNLQGTLGLTVYTYDPTHAPTAGASSTPQAPAAPSAPPASAPASTTPGGTQ